MTSPLALARVVARAHGVAAEDDSGYALRLLGKAQAYAPETAWAGMQRVTGAVTASAVNPAVVTNHKLWVCWACAQACGGSAEDFYILIETVHPDGYWDEGVLAAPRGIPDARFTSIAGSLTVSSPGRPASAAVALVGVTFFAIPLPWTTGLSPWRAWMQAARCSGVTALAI